MIHKNRKIAIGLILSCSLFFNACFSPEKDIKDKNYTGTVVAKYVEDMHQEHYIEIDQGSGEIIRLKTSYYKSDDNILLYPFISIGDSIFKPAGKYALVVFRRAQDDNKIFRYYYYGKRYWDQNE